MDEAKQLSLKCKRGKIVHLEHNNESWSGRVLVDAGNDGKQEIYFSWPNIFEDTIILLTHALSLKMLFALKNSKLYVMQQK